MHYYRVKVENRPDVTCKSGYLAFDDGSPRTYTRGEAIKKASMFEGSKIEVVNKHENMKLQIRDIIRSVSAEVSVVETLIDNMKAENTRLTEAVLRLLDCPDLNMDSLESETIEAIEGARRALNRGAV